MPGRWLLTAVIAVGLGYVFVRDLDASPYDDAYFFKRFALVFLEHGSFSWNVADGPVHGLTSQLLQAVAAGLSALAPDHYVVAVKAFSFTCLTLGAWLFSGSALRISGRADVAAALTLLVFGNPLVLASVHSGMETALTLLLVTLALETMLAPAAGRSHAVLQAALGVLVYLCRPDAALIVVVGFVASHFRDKRCLVAYVATLALSLGACLLAFRVYYGTALPLSFHLKTLGIGAYDEAVRALAVRDKLVHFATFAVFAAPFVWLSRPATSRLAFALALAAALFVAYHVVFTAEIMGYRARFYVPALVPLGLSAAFGSERALSLPRRDHVTWLTTFAVVVALSYAFGVVGSASSAPPERVPWPAYAAHALVAGWLLFAGEPSARERPALGGVAALFLLGLVATHPPRHASFRSDREFLEQSSAEVTTTRGVFDVERCLPKLRTLYHSEVGVPGLLFPEARVVDLAGLMSRSLALEHPRFDAHCLKDRPEALFLPHKNYVELNREIAASACLRDYQRVVRQSSSPLYVRSDLADEFLRCARDVEQWQ